jgi:hypothetical protein
MPFQNECLLNHRHAWRTVKRNSRPDRAGDTDNARPHYGPPLRGEQRRGCNVTAQVISAVRACADRKGARFAVRLETRNSPRRTQLEPGFIERGTLRLKRLRRAAIIAVIPWNGSSEAEPNDSAIPKEPRDPLKLARYYQSLLDSRRFENRAALAR